jgi:DNA helicase IV
MNLLELIESDKISVIQRIAELTKQKKDIDAEIQKLIDDNGLSGLLGETVSPQPKAKRNRTVIHHFTLQKHLATPKTKDELWKALEAAGETDKDLFETSIKHYLDKSVIKESKGKLSWNK